MKEQFIQLMDGTRLEAKINFGTLYYLQECGADALAKKMQYRQKKGKKPSNTDMMQFSAKVVYATLRSNGRMVTFDEALQLMPPDLSELQVIVDMYQEHIENLKKKQQAKQNMRMMQQK